MKINNNFNYLVIFKSYIFIIIFQILISLIQSEKCSNCIVKIDNGELKCKKSEGNDCNCSNPRPHFDNYCYICDDSTGFYNIKNDGDCQSKSSCLNKVIMGSNECVGHCPDNYCELGDFCYNNDENFLNKYNMTKNHSLFYCKCDSSHKKEKISEESEVPGKELYRCVDSCSSKYYNSDTGECVTDCGTNTMKNENNEWRCSLKCKNDECEYFNGTNKICLDADEEDIYKYETVEKFIYEKIDGKKCVDRCNKEDIYNGYKCVEKCTPESYIVYTDIGSDYFAKSCMNSNENLKEYNGIYFTDCNNTKKLFNKTTIEVIDENLCVEDCSSINKYLLNGKCVNKCEGNKTFYYNNICLENCSIGNIEHEYNMNFSSFGENKIADNNILDNINDYIITINLKNYPESSKCLEKCPTGTYIDTIKKQCYVLKCDDDKYINSTFECDICMSGKGFIFNQIIYLKIESGENTSTEPETGGRRLDEDPQQPGVYNITRKFCLSSCPKSSPYYDYENNECFSYNCSERRRYSAYDNPYICYNSCSLIGEGDYKNEKDYICYKEQVGCNKDYFYFEGSTKICANDNECREKGFKYIQEKECVESCNSTYYTIEYELGDDNKVNKLGSCLLDANDCITQGYKYYDANSKNCSKICKSFKTYPELSKNENNETCFEKCPLNYPFEDKDDEGRNICVKECNKFVDGNKCIDNCLNSSNNSFYHFENSKECVSSCKKDNITYYSIKGENIEKICYYSCPSETPFIQNHTCSLNCSSDSPYYYDDLKECRNDCDILFHSNETKCVYQCAPGEKVNGKNCTGVCPPSLPYILKDSLSNSIPTFVEKCVGNCSEEYPLISTKNKYCLKECPLDENYEYNGSCYEQCPNDTYSDVYQKKCFNNITKCNNTDFKYYEYNNGTYICQKSCSFGKFYLEEGGECMDICPDGYNYTGNDFVCLKNCSSKYGEYFERYNNNYKCLKTCEYDKYLVYDTKECVSNCPVDYYESPNKICYKQCNLDTEYPFSTINFNGSKKICSKKCNDSEPNFGDDKICTANCNDSDIIDYDGKCVKSCDNQYYKYVEKGKCVHKCSNYVKNKKECVDECVGEYNYIQDSECSSSCDEPYFAEKINGTNMFLCKSKCTDDKYYYEIANIFTIRKCFDGCGNDFNIQETKICTTNCPSDYYSYYYIKNSTNATYTNNTCVKKCPKDKPYINLLQCFSECPYGNKYHLEGDFNCISECPVGSKIENNECKSECTENKFLDNNQCVDNCTAPNIFYMDGSRKCVSSCENGYYSIESNEGKKCVKICDGDYPFKNKTIKSCVRRCESGKYYVNNTEEGSQKICLDGECPKFSYSDKDSNLTKCQDECNYKYNGTSICKDICEEDYKFWDYKNGTCLEQCPQNTFYINDTKYLINNTICYEKCPSQYPYFNNNSKTCGDKCAPNKYLNYSSRECLDECNGGNKIFNDNETIYCLEDCKDLGLFNFGDKCIRNCSEENENLVGNMDTKECECLNFFYIENNEKKCVDNCDNTYKYRLFGKRECLQNCKDKNYTLSLDEQYCYGTEDNCPPNTEKKKYTTNLTIAEFKCDCSYKFYRKNDDSKVCLGENEECPIEYSYINEGSSECSNCTNGTKIGKMCLSEDKSDSFWYLDETDKQYHSIDDCKENNLIEKLNQCVKNCKNDNYRVYPNLNNINRCLPNCDTITNTKVKFVNNSRSDYECECIDLWYRDNNSMIHCNNDTEKKTCKSAFENKIYLIKETKECVIQCPNNYSFLFGNECFKNCEDIQKYYGFVGEGNSDNVCKCRKLWKNENGKIICINSEICHEDKYMKLISNTSECVNECPNGYKEFNNICYPTCVGNLIDDEINDLSCRCHYKWYLYNDKALNVTNIIKCLGEKDECPKDFYPYLDYSNNQCVENTSYCNTSIIFNYTCYSECPNNTQPKTPNTCECDKSKGRWLQYTFEGKVLYQCGLDKCPNNKKYLDFDSNECKYTCENNYYYNYTCYKECPANTKLVDELTKECVYTYPFEESNDLKSLEENIKTNIKDIYEKTSSNGIIYNINNSTMQLYGVNKNKEDKKDVIMRNNLTYIDLSYCLDKLYEKNGLSEDTDIIIVKYDLTEKTNGSTINPVEFKVINSKTGQEIPLDACDENSIIISYPLMNILNRFITDSNNLRNLEEEKKNNLNLREKFLKGKEIYIDNEEIDTFDLSNKLYTDICYPFKMSGKDLILEDRLNYLYPFCSFCESNCIYNKTDFISERVYCNCNPKDQINFDRNLELMKSEPDMAKTKKDQKASILKCLGKISEISKNFGFFYGIIIILAEIAMCLLTFLYSYKVFVMRLNRKFDIKGDDNINNINTENIESVNLSGRDKKYNKNEEIIRTSERNLENPPKKKKQINIIETKEDKKEKRKNNKKKTTNIREEIIGNADLINIKKSEKDKNSKEDRLTSNDYNLYVEKSSIGTFKDSEEENIFELIKLESTLLKVDYQKALQKNKAEILIMILTEILDKLYIVKAIWFLPKYTIVSLYISLYLLWHMLILSFLSLFYNYSNLHKIWIKDNYPNLNFHLSFGFLSCIISFIFYKGLCFLIFNDRKISELENLKRENNSEMKEKYKKMMFWSKIKIIIFYAVVFILSIIFFLYLMAFCAVYIRTKAKLFESYGIALIEVVIIKILYGIVLGILRKISLTYEIEKLYFIVRILDLYIS